MTGCGFCGAPRGRWWPFCTACHSLFGVPVVAWVIIALFGIGFYAILTDRVPHG